MSSIRSRFCTLCSGDTVADDDFGLPCSRHVFMLKVSKFLYTVEGALKSECLFGLLMENLPLAYI